SMSTFFNVTISLTFLKYIIDIHGRKREKYRKKSSITPGSMQNYFYIVSFMQVLIPINYINICVHLLQWVILSMLK
ncbi:unnamed protein product, partial [Rangifer tarandus platyrhynchus]